MDTKWKQQKENDMSITEEMIKAVDAWESEYSPIANPFNDHGWNGLMFETYGDDWGFVLRHMSNHVWTWVDGDDGTFLVTGFHYVNRIGYFVTDKPWTTEQTIQVDAYEEN
jgi:hypothetical protein